MPLAVLGRVGRFSHLKLKEEGHSILSVRPLEKILSIVIINFFFVCSG
jgi:hypothetical protein